MDIILHHCIFGSFMTPTHLQYTHKDEISICHWNVLTRVGLYEICCIVLYVYRHHHVRSAVFFLYFLNSGIF